MSATERRVSLESAGAKNTRGEKKAVKGRRSRRAAAEQRRRGQYLNDDDEDFSVATANRSSSCSHVRRNSAGDDPEQYLNGLENDDLDLDVALALSVSISEQNSISQIGGPRVSVLADMTYENLAQLENVRCVAPAAVVDALPVCSFRNEQAAVSQVCVICQGEYVHGDSQVRLPCLHSFHQACGAEWLLRYSRFCPVCKYDVIEVATEAM